MRKLLVGLMALGFVTLGATQAQAQFRFGANVSWATDTDFGLGARANFGLGEFSKRNPIEGQVTFDYFFPNGFDYWELSGNGIYRFDTSAENLKPYAGAGLLYSHSSVNGCPGGYSCGSSDLGLNLIGGLRFNVKGTTAIPFVEARLEVRNGSQFVMAGGVLFGKP